MRCKKFILPLCLIVATSVNAQEPLDKTKEHQEKFKQKYSLMIRTDDDVFARTVTYWTQEHSYKNIRIDKFGYGDVFMDATRPRDGSIDYFLPPYMHEDVAQHLWGDIAGDVALDMTPLIREKVNKVEVKVNHHTEKFSVKKDWISIRSVFSFSQDLGGRIVFPNIDTRLDLCLNKVRIGYYHYFDNGAYLRLSTGYRYNGEYEAGFFASVPLEYIRDLLSKNVN